MNYGDKIKELRKSFNLSQTTVADKMGIAQTSYSDFEKRAEPPLDFIRKALAVLSPEVKLFEFIADPEDLTDYVPSWIMKEDLDMLKALYSLPVDLRMKIRQGYNQYLETVLEAMSSGKN